MSVALLLIAGACVACTVTQPSPSPAPDEPVTAEATRDGVRLRLTVERAPVPSADRTWAVVTVDNGAIEPVLYQGGGCDFLASVDIRVASRVTPEVGRAWDGLAGRFKGLIGPGNEATDQGLFTPEAFVDRGPIMCTADLGVNELAPGGHAEMRAAWDGDVAALAAPPGPATITASFPMHGLASAVADPFGTPRPLIATIPVDVLPSADRLTSPGLAIDAALRDPGFGGWVTGAPFETWQGVDLRLTRGAFLITLERVDHGVRSAGMATVNRRTGAVDAFTVTPNP